MDEQSNKRHKSHIVGSKARQQELNRKKKKFLELEPNRGSNPKAFLGNSNDSYKIKAQRQSLEKREHTYHVPELDGTLTSILKEPPLLVAVVGPPQCGKTTLIRSMVKFYSHRNLQKLRGPVTVIAGRSRRLTFIECPNTLNAMCDIAKTADLILLMVDGAFGFEMETFEFLNIAQVHGFPRVIGIVSHLDVLKNSKALKKRKKFLRHRFWHEVVDGAKMICLSPMQHNMYRNTDVLKLHQLLICVNTKVQQWRNTHSCIFVDRHEDLTDPDELTKNSDMNRTIAFYGYVRGKPLKPTQMIHIPGLGDYPLKYVSHQDDPCSFENITRGNSQGHKMRHLSTKQKRIYAPYCDVGGLTYDEDAVYIQEDAEKHNNVDRGGEGLALMRELQKINVTVDDATRNAEFKIYSGGNQVIDNNNNGEGNMRNRRPMKFNDNEDSYGDNDMKRLDLEVRDDDVDVPDDYNKEGYTFDDDEDYKNDSGNVKGADIALLNNDDDSHDSDDLAYERLANQSDKDDIENDLDAYGGDTFLKANNSSPPTDFLAMANKNAIVHGNSYINYTGLILDYELCPRMPNDADTVVITRFHHDWDNDGMLARVKNMFVTGKWKKSEGGMGNDDDMEGDDCAMDNEDEFGDEENNIDKGYDSEDEEFQQLIRGEKILKRQQKQERVQESKNELVDSGEDNEEDEGRPLNSEGVAPVKRNALAGLTCAHHTRMNKMTSYNNNNNNKHKNNTIDNDDNDGYNILDDEDDEDEGKGQNNHTKGFSPSNFSDLALSSLVDHFITRNFNTSEKYHPLGSGGDGTQSLGIENDAAESANLIGGSRGRTRDPNVDDNTPEDLLIAQGEELTEEQHELMKKRMAKKKLFDTMYDNNEGPLTNSGNNNNICIRGNATTVHYRHLLEVKDQKEKDLKEALKMVGEDLDNKIALVGYFSGLYVRVVIENVPVEFIRNFDPTVPILMGGLNNAEEHLQYIHTRIKRHRWYPRILKALDPCLISMGWRRFQTQPIFAAEDPNGRLRYLKYTPLHMHCYASFYGPVTPPNTGFIVIPVIGKRTQGFRPTATGYTLGNDESTQTLKKLKLIGYPEKVQKTTVFVKGMFNSDIEAAKFVGAKVKSVSGLRGIIKAVIQGKRGLIRCTFEDKILMSDIVFLRTWKPVDPPRYCAMAPTLLDPHWSGMRPMRELRREFNIPLSVKPDSEYTGVKKRRSITEDEPIHVPLARSTRLMLPFELKESYVALEGARLTGISGASDDSPVAAVASSDAVRLVMAATTVAPSVREMNKRALLDAFRNRADKLDRLKKEGKKRAKERKDKDRSKEEEQYKENLKKAKKETARMQEFRSQHKSRS